MFFHATGTVMKAGMRSDVIKKGNSRAPHRSLLRATGQIRDARDFDKPFIAAVSYTHLTLPTNREV